MKLRSDYQVPLRDEIFRLFNTGVRNVLAVMPTGAGKTKTFVSIAIDIAIAKEIVEHLKEFFATHGRLPTAVMVHRKELLQQISLTLAEEGIVHNIVAQPNTIAGIQRAHRTLFNKVFYSHSATVACVSVDTFKNEKYDPWAKTVRFVIIDEAAHVLKENKWGKAIERFVNRIFVLGVTATPKRLDRKGLGSHSDGIFDAMVQGPTTRWLIQNGYLANYKMAIAETDYQQFLGTASAGSDFSKETMMYASEKSHIVGDTIDNYIKYCNGKQAIVFASDMPSAKKMEDKFNKSGIPAVLLTAESTDAERLNGLIRFRKKEIKVLINIDLFDEGLDVPGIDAVILARPTMSLSKYLQMCGRALRPVFADGYDIETKEGRLAAQANGPKPYAIIIDQVGNRKRHQLPDTRRVWSLDSYKGERTKVLELVRRCWNWQCDLEYERFHTACPYCGTPAVKPREGGGGRVPPALVDGDLVLCDPETLRELEQATELEDPAIVGQRVTFAAGRAAGIKAIKDQQERIQTQKELAQKIAEWAGKLKAMGYEDRQIHKEFYARNGDKTIHEVLALPRADMLKIMEDLE